MRRIRAAAHVHSSWSYDGRWSLSQIALTFRRLGYDAVLLAEHDRGFDAERWSAYRRGCADASTESMLLVPGIEYSDPSNSVHVPVWGDVPFLGAGIETGELLSRSEEAGAAAIIAHIGRREVWRILQDEWLNRVVGVELWNRKYDGYAPNQPAARLLQERSDLLPFVSLDFHTARRAAPARHDPRVDERARGGAGARRDPARAGLPHRVRDCGDASGREPCIAGDASAGAQPQARQGARSIELSEAPPSVISSRATHPHRRWPRRL